MNALGPPVEAGGRADEIRPRLQRGAAGELGVLQILDGGKVLVDQRGVSERPQVLGRLQFGGIGREKEQVHVVWDPEADAGMPAGAIEHQHDLLAGTGTRLTRELRELHCKDGDADRRGEMKKGAAGGGVDKAHQIAPREAVLHGGDGPLADRCPHPTQQRFQADAMLVGRPHAPPLDLGVRKGGGHRLQQRPYFFF